MGYRAGAKKAQGCQQEITYLGNILKWGRQMLSQAQETILSMPTTSTKRQVLEFLRSAGFCRLWVLGFTEVAKPLYEATRGQEGILN